MPNVRILCHSLSAKVQSCDVQLCSPTSLLCCAVLCCVVLCHAVLCCAVPCCAVLCCAVLCCAVLCCAVLCCAVPCHVLNVVHAAGFMAAVSHSHDMQLVMPTEPCVARPSGSSTCFAIPGKQLLLSERWTWALYCAGCVSHIACMAHVWTEQCRGSHAGDMCASVTLS